jgi:hypothetical protein
MTTNDSTTTSEFERPIDMELEIVHHSLLTRLGHLISDLQQLERNIADDPYRLRTVTSPAYAFVDLLQYIQRATTLAEVAENPKMVTMMLGKRGGSAKTEAKAAASRENGKKGGRPKQSPVA